MAVRTVLLSVILAGGAGAQTGTNVQPGQTAPSFRSTTQLVVETVVVKNNEGHPISGLKAADFTITEDGSPQQIKLFEYQRLDPATRPVATEERHAATLARPTRTQIVAPVPGDSRYRDHRLLALYFDLTAMPVLDQVRGVRGRQEVRPHPDDRSRPDSDHDLH